MIYRSLATKNNVKSSQVVMVLSQIKSMLSCYDGITSCCSQMIPKGPNPCYCHWNFWSIHSHSMSFHVTRSHVIHFLEILSHFHWNHCSSSPHPHARSVPSCSHCGVRQRGPDCCCRCPLRPVQALLPLQNCQFDEASLLIYSQWRGPGPPERKTGTVLSWRLQTWRWASAYVLWLRKLPHLLNGLVTQWNQIRPGYPLRENTKKNTRNICQKIGTIERIPQG